MTFFNRFYISLDDIFDIDMDVEISYSFSDCLREELGSDLDNTDSNSVNFIGEFDFPQVDNNFILIVPILVLESYL